MSMLNYIIAQNENQDINIFANISSKTIKDDLKAKSGPAKCAPSYSSIKIFIMLMKYLTLFYTHLKWVLDFLLYYPFYKLYTSQFSINIGEETDIFHYESTLGSEEDVDCAVCLCKIGDGEEIRVLRCEHVCKHSIMSEVQFKDKEVFLKLGSLFGSASVTSAELSGVQSAASFSIGSGQTWQFPELSRSSNLLPAAKIPHEFFGKGDRMVQVKGKVQDQHFSVMIVMSLPITQAIPCIANDPSKKTQHMFNDIIHSIIYMDADVITTENSRSDEKLSSAFCEGVKHGAGFGHGVHDIHSLTKDSTNRRNC
ncbi:hypothetical protein VNO77_39677 [Canavalia gladiata]|uniref:Cobalamin-independent methionine synthase MetE C-terminal/archaeal domain-containing protein n=1 Tax=Canavalia gladiata TaxID=3824 RepID=A0AAN9JZ18_CANGL